jgi:two-component system response regulator YesN
VYRIAIIDDNRASAEAIAQAIDWEAMGCRVIGVAYGGKQGLQLIEEKKPHIIIADILMPGLDGLEMVERSKKLSPNSHVLFISAYDNFRYAQKAIGLKAANYLLKPFHYSDLEAAVEAILAEHPKGEPLEEALKGEDTASLLVNSMLQFMRENLSQPLPLKRLSKRFGLVPSYISTLFKRHTGHPYSEVLADLRLGKAKQLLLDPTMQINEVALAVGYKNYITFYKAFMRMEGITPSGYRNRKGKEARE